MSLRGDEWSEFAMEVIDHIDNYTVPQYGDKNEDTANDYTAQQCIDHIKRYANRHGKNSRPGQEKLDLLKIAHYAQLAHSKLQEEENAKK